MTNLIPKPVSISPLQGTFTLAPTTSIHLVEHNADLYAVAANLAALLTNASGVAIFVHIGEPTAPARSISLQLTNADPTLGDEGYTLTVTPQQVQVIAAAPAGLFYGVQTIRQLLATSVNGGVNEGASAGATSLPACVIHDAPRFAWRGLMLDVARHFFGVADVKRVIDLMALYKLNRLHLHLTDDQGWRIMINSWPRLATYGGSTAVGGGAGGYYSQADYAEIVAYAQSRFITVVPEIDLPGHTNSALASYPELNRSEEAPPLYTQTAVGFSTLCTDMAITYKFLDDVIGELAALTPGPYIHIGGDEADATPLEEYLPFIERVQQIVHSHGKQVVGWEEVSHSRLAPGTLVQLWRSDLPKRAVEQGARVILSPASRTYLDMKYDESWPLGLKWAGFVEVETAYDWQPATLVAGIGEQDIVGVEATIWSETLETIAQVESMLFPRLPGVAEVAWSTAESRDWQEYRLRLAGHEGLFNTLGINFYRSPQVPWQKGVGRTEAFPSAPLAKVAPTSFEQHGQRFVDPYAWLQDKDDPAVIAYLEAENAYAAGLLRHTLPLQEQLFQEMRGRIQEDDASAPQRNGDFLYYTRVEAGKQYRLICRKRNAPDAAEEVLLDENALAAGNAYCNIFRVAPSPDHTLLAYTLDTTGALVYDLFVIDATSGALVCGPIANVAWSVVWSADGSAIFYTTFDAAHRAYRLYRHRLGDDPAQAALVYEEPDDAFSIDIARTRSGAFLLLTSVSHTSTEVRYLAADQPAGQFRLIHPRQPWHEYYVDHRGDRFLIRSDENAENFKLLEAPVSAPHKENWRELIPHRGDTLLEDVDLFRNHLVLYERRAGMPLIRICDPDGQTTLRNVDFPEPVYTISTSLRGNPFAVNPEFDAITLRIFYSSLVTPNSTVDIGLGDGSWTVRKQQAVASGYDLAQYAMQRLYAPAADGAAVPISLVYRKDVRQAGGNPLLLKGYGAYGYSSEPGFDANLLSLLDRGFVYAIAHIRGGSELGRSWYEQGRLLHKKNSFTDFIACAEHLISEGWTTPDRLAMRGRSAGGLLMSAVANMRPDLARAMVAEVAYANVITAMLMPELPLTVSEYEQWGNPADPEAFAYMLSYSPYDNVEAKAYPHIYATAGLNDLQVPYWDPAKWVARLRATKTDHNRLLLITNMAAGHGGASGRYNSLREEARVYAFLIDTLRVANGEL